MAEHAFLYYTHLLNDVILREIDRLSEELPSSFDLWVIGCVEDAHTFDDIENSRVKKAIFSRREIDTLPYREKLLDLKPGSTRGSNDLAIMAFFRTHSGYTKYWISEYDVRYTGLWEDLLIELGHSAADLLCAHVVRFINNKNWVHWSTLKAPDREITGEQKVRGFLPFCRVSGQLMKKIDDYCTAGWTGHYEALWPTIATLEGLLIEEIGGKSEFTPTNRHGKFYHSSFVNQELFLSTFAAWPVYDEGSNFNQHVKNTLWHPVKVAHEIHIPQPLLTDVHQTRQKAASGVAVVTMVYNEPDFLPLWHKYYSGQVGREHCYVIDHGSDDGSIAQNRLENRIYLPRTANFEQARCSFVTSFCKGLLSYYHTVIYSDVDEFLVCDPSRFESLVEFCNVNSESVITALGLNLIHRFKYDTPLVADRPVLEQRKWAFASAAMSKPLVIRRPVKWTKGFHSYNGPIVFDGLFNFHLPLYDYHTALRRQAKRRHASSTMTDVGSHHQMTDDDLTSLFKAYSSMSVDDTVTLNADCPASRRFINKLMDSTRVREGQYYSIDLGLKGDRLWAIPDGYRKAFLTISF